MSKEAKYNRSTTPLNAGETFTGKPEECSIFEGVVLYCYTDKGANLTVQFGIDANNFDYSEENTITAETVFTKHLTIKANYFRLILENTSGENQTELRLSSRFITDACDVLIYGNDGNKNKLVKTDNTGRLDVTMTTSNATSSIQMYGVDNTDTKQAVLTTTDGVLRTNLEGKYTSIVDSDVIIKDVGCDRFGNLLTTTPLYKTDTIGRDKVSLPFTILEITHTIDSNTRQVSETLISNGTSTHKSNMSSMELTVTGNGDSVLRRSRTYAIYQPGKTMSINSTGILNYDTNGVGVKSRIGYYDTYNGFFFEHEGDGGAGTTRIVKRTYVSGAVVNTEINQSSWNVDKLNGTGLSEVTIDFSKMQLYYIDFLWQGAGIVRMGVYYRGQIIICHIFTNETNTGPYITTGNLPISYELTSTNGAGKQLMTCAVVYSEGGYEPLGRFFSIGCSDPVLGLGIGVDDNYGLITVNTNNPDGTSNFKLLLAIRMKIDDAINNNKFTRHTKVLIKKIDIITSSNSNAYYVVYRIRDYDPETFSESAANFLGRQFDSDDATPADPSGNQDIFKNVPSGSAIQYFIETNSSTYINKTSLANIDIQRVYSGYVSGSQRFSVSDLDTVTSEGLTLSVNNDGFTDYLVFYGAELDSNSPKMGMTIQWKEIF